jgi:uncharacterized protein YrrD
MFQAVIPASLSRFPKPKSVPMLKGNDLIGKPIAIHHQTAIGVIQDVIFDYASNQVIAFVIDKPGWRTQAHIIPWSGIHSVSNNGLVARSKNMIVVANQLYRVRQILGRENLVKGMSIVTLGGLHLGIKTDFYFSERTGAVQGYEAKGGIFAEPNTDSGFIPVTPSLKVSKNAAYMPQQVARQMEEFSPDVIQLPQGAEQAVGRRIRQAVRTDGGSLIGAVGQIVTDGILALARAHGKEHELLQAAGIQPDSTD